MGTGMDANNDSKSFLVKVAHDYDRYLRQEPLMTKSLTSGAIFFAGDAVAQMIAPKPGSAVRFSLRSSLAFGGFGLFISGPLIHYFYGYLDKAVPKGSSKWAGLYRVIIDRLLLAPPYLLLLFYTVPLLEGKSQAEAIKKIKETFPDVMKMNVKVWSIFQYININFVPQRYRVLFMAMLSFVWNIYVAIKRR